MIKNLIDFIIFVQKEKIMKAYELKSKTDKKGHLKIDYNLGRPLSNVRILILLDEVTSDQEEENLWMNSISNNPAFDFLNDSSEDIYSLKDGEPLND